MLSELVEARVDPRPLAVTRVLVGLAAVVMAFDSRSLLVRISAPGKLRVPTLSWLPDPSVGMANAVLVLLAVAGALLAAGVLARVAAGACAVLAVTPLVIDQQAYSNHGVLLAALGALLVLTRPDEALSVAALRRREPPAPVPYWPLFLIKVQIATLYLWAAVAKVNRSYFTDETLQTATAGWARDLIPDALFLAAAVAVLVSEAFLAVALWRRRTRPLAYGVGLTLHAGLVLFGWAPIGLVPFAVLVLSAYPLFLQDPVWGEGGLPAGAERRLALLRD